MAGLWSWRQRNSAVEGGIACVCGHSGGGMGVEGAMVVLKEKKGVFMGWLILPKGVSPESLHFVIFRDKEPERPGSSPFLQGGP